MFNETWSFNIKFYIISESVFQLRDHLRLTQSLLPFVNDKSSYCSYYLHSPIPRLIRYENLTEIFDMILDAKDFY